MTVLLTGGAGLLGLHLVRENLLAGRHVTVLAKGGARAAHERVEQFLVASGAADRLPARPRDLLAVVPVDLTHHSLGLSPGQERALAGRATALWRAEHTAEGLVRRWANRHGRTALILRPGILVPGPATAGIAEHPLGVLARTIAAVAARADRSARLVLRLPSQARSHLNLLQADHAARAMLRLGERVTDPGTGTVHIVHPVDTPVRAIARAIEDVLPVRLRMTPNEPVERTRAERAFRSRGAAFLPYLTQRRRFDGTTLRGHGVELTPPPLGRDHLRELLVAELSTEVGRAVA